MLLERRCVAAFGRARALEALQRAARTRNEKAPAMPREGPDFNSRQAAYLQRHQ